jgi:hypothetical protein
VWGFTDSFRFVEQMISGISTSKERKGTNSVQAFSRSLLIAGYFRPRASWNSPNRFVAALRWVRCRRDLRALATLSQLATPAAQRTLLRRR